MMVARSPGTLRWWIVWSVLSAVLLIGVADLFFDAPVWRVPKRQLLPLAVLLAAFGAASLVAWFLSLSPNRSMERVALATAAVFGFAFLALVVTSKVHPSPALVITVALLGMILVPTFYLLSSRWRAPAAAIVATLAMVSFALASAEHSSIERERHAPRVEESFIKSSLYTLSETHYRGYVPKPIVRGGGLELIGTHYLLGTGDGNLYVLHWSTGSSALQVKRLPYRVPLNGEQFAKDVGGVYAEPENWNAVKKAGTVQTWRFRVGDILTRQVGSKLQLFATHHFWHSKERCYVARVSMLEGETAQFLAGTAGDSWRTVFESTPCMSLEEPQETPGNPFVGEEIGGRLAFRDDHTLLLALGGMAYDGLDFKLRASQDPKYSWGKTLAIDPVSGTSRIFSSGHRNQQGLYIDGEGRIWITEHGPQGGDELNLLRDGIDYGWPTVTYGTSYGSLAWQNNPTPGEHAGYELPQFAWVPSIGISAVTGVQHDLFALWRDDLLIGSLATQSLYRARVREGRVVYVEPLAMEHRIRDVIEGPDGQLVLWTDDASIVTLRPAVAHNAPALFATLCSGCHTAVEGAAHGIGPNLWGVAGAPVASREAYGQYSGALFRLGGQWDSERLDAFLAQPQRVAPGTTMQFPGVPDPGERRQLVEFLQGLHPED
jgi:aldose sugar dehydrogenase